MTDSTNDFDEAIEAQLRNAKLRFSELVQFDFAGETVRLWNGSRNIVLDGKTWKGLGGLGSLTPIESQQGGVINSVTFSLAATSEMQAFFIEDNARVVGRPVKRYLQFFEILEEDEDGNWIEWDTIGSPILIFWGTLGPLTSQRIVARDPRMPNLQYMFSVTAVNTFSLRSRPAFGYYSDVDQNVLSRVLNPSAARDNIFINVPTFMEATVRWP